MQALDADAAAGYDKMLVHAATGTGKTVAFLWWLDRALAQQDGRALIMVDMRKLAYQAHEKMETLFPHLHEDSGIVMSELNDPVARVVVATRQTLAARNGERLREVLAHGPITHYVVDEAHGDVADQFRFVEHQLRQVNPALLKTGWTATPYRADKNGLITKNGHHGAYDKLSFSYPVQAAIRDGALSPFKAFAVGLPVSFAGLSETPTGWDADELGDLLDAENIWEIILSVWRGETENAPDATALQTMIFTASVKQARGGAEYFQRHGVAAEYAHGGTPQSERDEIEARFESGETRVLFNCQLYVQGADFPSLACAMNAAPTKSRGPWVQKMGRALRRDPRNPDKTAYLVDFYPIDRGVVFAADALGVPKAVREAKEKAEEEGVLIGWSMDGFGRSVAVRMDEVVVKALDLMSKSGKPWTLSQDLKMSTALSEDLAACIVLPDPDRLERAEAMRGTPDWTAAHEAYYDHVRRPRLYAVHKNGRGWTAKLHAIYEDVADAKAEVDAWPTDNTLGSRSAPWRNRPATDGQLRFLTTLCQDEELEPDITRGEASQRISEALVLQAVEKAESQVWANCKSAC